MTGSQTIRAAARELRDTDELREAPGMTDAKWRTFFHLLEEVTNDERTAARRRKGDYVAEQSERFEADTALAEFVGWFQRAQS